MKILHWDEMFHPHFGYQINVLTKFQARQGHDVTIFTSDKIEEHPAFSAFGNSENIYEEDKLFTEKYNVKIVRLPIKKVISGRVIYSKGYIERIIKYNPDVIMCHTNDTISAINIARNHKKINKPLLFDNHMLRMASVNPLRYFFRIYFRMFVTPKIKKQKWTVIRTQNDDYINSCLGIPREQTPFISFGSDTTIFSPNEDARRKFRIMNNISENDFVVVYTGKLSEPKGGLFLAESVLRKFNTDKNVVIVVVGNSSGEYGVKVEDKFSKSKNTVLRFPTQKYTDLAEFYQAADLSVFPKQCSLSFYDAQACGLPVISENNNINIDRLSHNNGFNYTEGDIEDFRSKIEYCANLSSEAYNKMGENAYKFVKEKYDYSDIARKYTDLLVREYQKFYGISK